jgi:hypothetical protein
MTKAIRGLLGRLAEHVLPATQASAGCAPDCYMNCGTVGIPGVPNGAGCVRCCYTPQCVHYCNG